MASTLAPPRGSSADRPGLAALRERAAALYGGTERVVSFLTEELVALGHQVTLFASGDSRTSAELVAVHAAALRLRRRLRRSAGASPAHDRGGLRARRRLRPDPLPHRLPPFSASRARGARHVTTLHGRLDLPDLVPLYRTFSRHAAGVDLGRAAPAAPVRALAGDRATTGCRATCYRSTAQPGAYLAFLGRMSPREARRPRHRDRPPRWACRSRSQPRSTQADRDYFDEIQPLLDDPLVEFVGEIGEAAEGRVPGRRRGAAVPDRLARAVRPGDGRGDGLRHAGRRVPPRLGARGGARWRHGLRGRATSTRRSAATEQADAARAAGACARTSRRASTSRAWRATYLRHLRGAGGAAMSTRAPLRVPTAAEA